MSALARFFLSQGKIVCGYDRNRSDLTIKLEEEGAEIIYEDTFEKFSFDLNETSETVVVYTPAIPDTNRILSTLKEKGYQLHKRSDILQEITKDKRVVAVAGTHGKTTVSSMIAHILSENTDNAWAFLGGIASNKNSNYYEPSSQQQISKSDIVVVEADEYDRSFLKLKPSIAVVTAIEADHLDVYGSEDEMRLAFQEFADRLNTDGVLIKHNAIDIDCNRQVIDYGSGQGASISAINIGVKNGVFHFDLKVKDQLFNDFMSNMPGRHNIENTVAAVAVCLQLGVGLESIRSSLRSFKGIKRRFEKIVETNDLVFIDDYAHHPGELDAAINAARELHPDKHLTGIFQPHLYSRTRDFANEFGKSLSGLDELMLLDIYPARELPIEGVTSELILEYVTCKKKLLTKNSLLAELQNLRSGVLMTLGAGDIDKLLPEIAQIIIEKKKIKELV